MENVSFQGFYINIYEKRKSNNYLLSFGIFFDLEIISSVLSFLQVWSANYTS